MSGDVRKSRKEKVEERNSVLTPKKTNKTIPDDCKIKRIIKKKKRLLKKIPEKKRRKTRLRKKVTSCRFKNREN